MLASLMAFLKESQDSSLMPRQRVSHGRHASVSACKMSKGGFQQGCDFVGGSRGVIIFRRHFRRANGAGLNNEDPKLK